MICKKFKEQKCHQNCILSSSKPFGYFGRTHACQKRQNGSHGSAGENFAIPRPLCFMICKIAIKRSMMDWVHPVWYFVWNCIYDCFHLMMLFPIFKTLQKSIYKREKSKKSLLANALPCDRGYFVFSMCACQFIQNSQISQMTSKCNSDGTSAHGTFYIW